MSNTIDKLSELFVRNELTVGDRNQWGWKLKRNEDKLLMLWKSGQTVLCRSKGLTSRSRGCPRSHWRWRRPTDRGKGLGEISRQKWH